MGTKSNSDDDLLGALFNSTDEEDEDPKKKEDVKSDEKSRDVEPAKLTHVVEPKGADDKSTFALLDAKQDFAAAADFAELRPTLQETKGKPVVCVGTTASSSSGSHLPAAPLPKPRRRLAARRKGISKKYKDMTAEEYFQAGLAEMEEEERREKEAGSETPGAKASSSNVVVATLGSAVGSAAKRSVRTDDEILMSSRISVWSSIYPKNRSSKQALGGDEDKSIKMHGYVIPGHIVACLRPYQVEGVAWMMERILDPGKPVGCILGDDMGLGKTIQVTCLLGALYFTQTKQDSKIPAFLRPRCSLIVAPPSIMENWRQELTTWGAFDVEIFRPGHIERLLERVQAGLCNVVICSRGLFSQKDEASRDLQCILATDWGCVVVDEVHECKNPETSLAINVSKLRSRRKLGLTGTPIANKIGEFWSLMRCVGAHKAFTREEFELRFSNPISEGMRKTTDVFKIAARDRATRDFQENILKKYFLRRTKAGVALHLPGKRDRIVLCPLSEIQQKAYENILASKDVEHIVSKKQNKMMCVCGKNDDCNMGLIWRHMHDRKEDVCRSWNHPWKCHSLSVMSYLQKVANHLDLLRPENEDVLHGASSSSSSSKSRDENGAPKSSSKPTGQAEQEEFERALCEMAFRGTEFELDAKKENNTNQHMFFRRSSNLKYCGKMQMLIKLLKLWSANPSSEVEGGGGVGSVDHTPSHHTTRQNKILVFSRSTRLLSIMEIAIRAQGYRCLRLDGNTPVKQRQALCSEFNSLGSNIFVFIISTRAGGVGLNLTGANKVVIFDPDWNPCLDLQAQDRSFRMGQTRFVEVFRLIAAGTVEEHMYLRQLYKQQLTKITIDKVKTQRRLDKEELEGIERFFVLDKTRMQTVILDSLDNQLLDDQRVMTSSDVGSSSPSSSPDDDVEKLVHGENGVKPAASYEGDDEYLKPLFASDDDESQQHREDLEGILGGCQQFNHDDCLVRDSQEEELADEAAEAYRGLMLPSEYPSDAPAKRRKLSKS